MEIHERIEGRPCPFCGGNNLIIDTREFFDSLVAEHGGALLYIACRDCHGELRDYSDINNYDIRRAMVLARWNIRAEGV